MAETNARPMPVFPLVGSTSTVFPGMILPAASASRIMLTPMRSFTLLHGFMLSSLATTVALHPAVTLFSRTSGVLPTSSDTSLAMRLVPSAACGTPMTGSFSASAMLIGVGMAGKVARKSAGKRRTGRRTANKIESHLHVCLSLRIRLHHRPAQRGQVHAHQRAGGGEGGHCHPQAADDAQPHPRVRECEGGQGAARRADHLH